MMAVGNKRGSKRPSSTSTYTSTITTVVFIAMCVLGVWMLTSNNLGPPPATRTNLSSEKKDETTTTDLYSDKKDETTTTNLSSDKKDETATTVFEDNPGDLPTDAIQPDDPKQNHNAGAGAGSAVGGGKNEEAKVGELSVDEQVKQKGQTQISEESTLTQIQQFDQNQQKSQESQNEPQPQQQQQKEDMTKQQLQEDAGRQQPDEISDEDKKQRVQQHGKEQKQILHEPIQKQENPQNPEETNANPKELPTQQAMQTDVEQQTATTMQEPIDTSKGNKKARKNKRDRTKEHKPATSTNTEEPAVETTGTKPGIPKESTESKKSWSTQAKQSANEKERREDESKGKESIYGYTWHLCNESTGADFIPCLDNEKALKKLQSTGHYEHRERHCPEQGPTCLVPDPAGYKRAIRWPHSRDKVTLNIFTIV